MKPDAQRSEDADNRAKLRVPAGRERFVETLAAESGLSSDAGPDADATAPSESGVSTDARQEAEAMAADAGITAAAPLAEVRSRAARSAALPGTPTKM